MSKVEEQCFICVGASVQIKKPHITSKCPFKCILCTGYHTTTEHAEMTSVCTKCYGKGPPSDFKRPHAPQRCPWIK